MVGEQLQVFFYHISYFVLFLGRFRLGLLHRNIFLGTNLLNVEATSLVSTV